MKLTARLKNYYKKRADYILYFTNYRTYNNQRISFYCVYRLLYTIYCELYTS